MKAQIQEQEQTTAEIIPGIFPLSSEPVDIQLTIHLNNYLLTYRGPGSVNHWKLALQHPDKPSPVTMINQIIAYYGVKNCRNFFKVVYGWNFNTKKSVNNKVADKAV